MFRKFMPTPCNFAGMLIFLLSWRNFAGVRTFDCVCSTYRECTYLLYSWPSNQITTMLFRLTKHSTIKQCSCGIYRADHIIGIVGGGSSGGACRRVGRRRLDDDVGGERRAGRRRAMTADCGSGRRVARIQAAPTSTAQ